VGLAVDGSGALLIADDSGNAVWRVSGAQTPASP
jgi:glucose/arabinose dehydrogenase